jgi:hypothetical protein
MIATMSKHAAEAKGCSDAMMFDYRGYVAEATGRNIFFVKDGEVHTPLPDCFLNGITRQTVIGMLRDRQIKVHERHIMPEELESFEQCWLTGTAAEVTPVGRSATGPSRWARCARHRAGLRDARAAPERPGLASARPAPPPAPAPARAEPPLAARGSGAGRDDIRGGPPQGGGVGTS